MKHIGALIVCMGLVLSFAACETVSVQPGSYVIAMHCEVDSEESGIRLQGQIPALAKKGVNTLILEVGYNFQWTSHPELASEYGLRLDTARELSELCRAANITLVPEINCIGHQSWEGQTGILLEEYPEFDETPGQYPGNEGIYCRSWCTSNEAVYPVLFDLIDELSSAFGSTAFHVGMDEIFLIGDDSCPRCRGKDRGQLLANAINALYRHIVIENGMTMYMWGDRLIDGADETTDYASEYESAMNGTHTAIDLIPKDIIICDWHYDSRKTYGSIPYFLDKGFRVLPASYNNVRAAQDLAAYSLSFAGNPAMLGHLYTTWCDIPNDRLASWKPMNRTMRLFEAGSAN